MRVGLRWLLAVGAGLATSLLLAPAAFAHLQGGAAAGLTSGLLHPLTGLDHVLAMLAVGLWAAQRGGAERWRLPLAFVGTMLVGGVLGMSGLVLPYGEIGIALSVLLLGVLIVSAPRLSSPAALALVAAAALLHGHAHGSELAAGLSPALYAAGFVAATAALHAAGVAAGVGLLWVRREGAALALRASGAGIAACGGLLLAALL
jgi:urease accessory protein